MKQSDNFPLVLIAKLYIYYGRLKGNRVFIFSADS